MSLTTYVVTALVIICTFLFQESLELIFLLTYMRPLQIECSIDDSFKELEGHLESTAEILDEAQKLHRQLLKMNALREDNIALKLHSK